MIDIPHEYVDAGFRFIKIRPRSKLPHETEFQSINNYHGLDPALLHWVRRNHSFEVHGIHYEGTGNYGLLCDDEHIVVDLDAPAIIEAATSARREGLLPMTRSVQSGSGKGKHLVFTTAGARTIVLDDPATGENVGHIKSTGGYAVAEGSLHDRTGMPYIVLDDLPVAFVPFTTLLQVFSPWIRPKASTREKTPVKHYGNLSGSTLTDELGLRIEQEAMPEKPHKTSTGWQGICPWHGSTGGMNFSINTRKNTWYCHRHGLGGDPIAAIAVREGFCTEDEASHLRDYPDIVRQVKEHLRQHGYGEKLDRTKVARRQVHREHEDVLRRLGL